MTSSPPVRLRPFRPQPFGRYTLLSYLATGGMGEIYLARLEGAQGFEKLCVIKKMLPQLAEDAEFVERFVGEARTLVKLSHGSVAQVLDMGLHEGEAYMALEYVDGKDLRKVAARVRDRQAPLPLTFVLYTLGRVLDALAYAHRKRDDEDRALNLVHRDISPQNILVSYEGEVKVIDFGLAKSRLSAAHTNPSVILGKFLYMSPEQARHQPVDRRSDLYAVGLCLYELIAGKNPFDAMHPGELMSAVANPRIPPLQDVEPMVPPAVAQVVMKSLEVDPARRFQTAEEFRGRLMACLLEIDAGAGPESVSRFMRELFTTEYQQERKLLAALKDVPRRAEGGAPPAPAPVPIDAPPSGSGPRLASQAPRPARVDGPVEPQPLSFYPTPRASRENGPVREDGATRPSVALEEPTRPSVPIEEVTSGVRARLKPSLPDPAATAPTLEVRLQGPLLAPPPLPRVAAPTVEMPVSGPGLAFPWETEPSRPERSLAVTQQVPSMAELPPAADSPSGDTEEDSPTMEMTVDELLRHPRAADLTFLSAPALAAPPPEAPSRDGATQQEMPSLVLPLPGEEDAPVPAPAPPPRAAEPSTPPPRAAEPSTPPPRAAERSTPPPRAAEPSTPPPRAAERSTPPRASAREETPVPRAGGSEAATPQVSRAPTEDDAPSVVLDPSLQEAVAAASRPGAASRRPRQSPVSPAGEPRASRPATARSARPEPSDAEPEADSEEAQPPRKARPSAPALRRTSTQPDAPVRRERGMTWALIGLVVVLAGAAVVLVVVPAVREGLGDGGESLPRGPVPDQPIVPRPLPMLPEQAPPAPPAPEASAPPEPTPAAPSAATRPSTPARVEPSRSSKSTAPASAAEPEAATTAESGELRREWNQTRQAHEALLRIRPCEDYQVSLLCDRFEDLEGQVLRAGDEANAELLGKVKRLREDLDKRRKWMKNYP